MLLFQTNKDGWMGWIYRYLFKPGTNSQVTTQMKRSQDA